MKTRYPRCRGRRLLPPALLFAASAASAGTSADLRESKNFQALGMPIGFSIFGGSGIKGGLILSRQLIFEGGYSGHASNMSGESVHVHNNLTATARYFPGNSFNINLGAAVKNYRFNYDKYESGRQWAREEEDDPKERLIARASAAGAWFTIGNQWILDGGFTIGCDWFGLYQPLVELSAADLMPNNASEEHRRKAKEKADDLNMEGNFILLNFYLGASF